MQTSEQAPIERNRFGLLVGRSPAMRRVFALMDRAAESDSTVLLAGEHGTGKSLAAESIHLESARHDQPFRMVDCASDGPDALLDQVLVGSAGTLFLDRVGELPPHTQARLSRLLEHARGMGRLIAASQRDLRAEVRARRFRVDLYYRLAVLEIALPPLRERPGDLELLMRDMLSADASAFHCAPPARGLPRERPRTASLLDPAFVAELGRHSWPGNGRELRSHLERCLALGERLPPSPETRRRP